MSPASDEFTELRDILEALCEERATTAQLTRLEDLARNDAAARRFYLEYIDLHGNLHWDAAQGHSVEEAVVPFLKAEPETPPRPSRQPAPVVLSSTLPAPPVRRTRRPFVLAFVAGGAAIVATLLAFVWSPWRSAPVVKEPSSAEIEHRASTAKESHVALPDNQHQRTDAARATTTSAPARPVAATVAVHRRSPRRPLAIVKKNAPLPKASLIPLIPLEPERNPIRAPQLPGDGTASPTTSDETEHDPAALVAFVDARLKKMWKVSGVEPSPLATDAEWIRRVSLDVIGHIPPEDAVDAFLDSDTPHKRAAVVARLLKDPGYARNWATVWTNLLVGRQPRTPGVHRDELEKFLRDSFAANVPWNEIVFGLVSAEGTAEHNPAANFLLAHLNQDAVPATALTARLFLGIQVQCTQCHDHPFTKDKQDRFWELNSFFQQTEVVSHPSLSTAVATTDGTRMEAGQASVPEIVTRPVGGPMYYETLKGEMRAAFPVYGGHKIDPGPAVNRRRELARLIAQGDDRQLALAMVNRTWQHFFGHGFTRPVDDMGPHNAANNPEVLNRLAQEFIASGYDLKKLIGWICATDAYQRASILDPENVADDPANGAAPLFTRVYLKPLSAEQLYDSLLVATRARSSARTDWNDAGLRREDWVRQFVYSYATEENDEASLPPGSVSQALTMMNDRIVDGALAVEPGTLLFDVAHDKANDAAKIRRLCRSALARNPTRPELDAALARLEDARQSAQTAKARERAAANALADIFWAYLNANEFALVH
jgi:hypothetical protein